MISINLCKAVKVGGDYYDYFELPDNKVGVMIGDVKGHGFDAGLMVSMVKSFSMVKSCLYMQLKNDYSLPSVMSAINEIIYEYGFKPNFMYMTFCYMIFDLKTHLASFSIAGHPFPRHYLASENRIADINLDFGNTLLGWDKAEIYDISNPESWGKGDVFILFTDGITDASNINEECYGEERLEEQIIKNAHLTPKEIKEKIL
ncbi:MAG: PP2C family protein-serine/threonine phosphatase [Candidatus Poribacteria bacterium]